MSVRRGHGGILSFQRDWVEQNKKRTSQVWTLCVEESALHDTVRVRWNHCSLHSECTALHRCLLTSAGVSPPRGLTSHSVPGHICPWVPALINISSKHFNTDSKYLTPHHNSLCCVICAACATWLERVCYTNYMHIIQRINNSAS